MENIMHSIDVINIKTALEKQEDPIKAAVNIAIKSSCTIKIQSGEDMWTGSGFHIGSGYIATVSHVAQEKLFNTDHSITITFDGTNEIPAKLVLSNTDDDTALMFSHQAKAQPFVELGNSDELEVGDIVAAIGAPEGWHDTATIGRVTNKNQNLGQYAPTKAWNDMIFIDADILEGSSGGELIATDGKVYGLIMGVTGYNAEIGIGQNAVVPINKFKKLLSMTTP